MNTACIYKVCALLLIKLIQIWDMLEVVCIKLSTLNYLVWSYIIIKYSNLKVISFFLKKWFCLLKDLCVRCCRCCNCDGFVIILCINACA